MCDRHQRAQGHVGVAAVAQLFGDRNERSCGAGLKPDVAAEDLSEPGKPRQVAVAEIERHRLIDQPASTFDETEVIGNLRRGDKARSLLWRVRRQCGCALQGRTRDGDGATGGGQAGVLLERGGDVLVGSLG